MLGAGAIVGGKRGWVLLERRAELRIERCSRVFGGSEECILAVQSNLAITYQKLGRLEEALRLKRDVYSGRLKLYGENERTLIAAHNLASSLLLLEGPEEARSLMHKSIPVARRVLGESNELTLKMRWVYARTLSKHPAAATLDDMHEAVTTLEEIERIARRALGPHPITLGIERDLAVSRAVLRAREIRAQRALFFAFVVAVATWVCWRNFLLSIFAFLVALIAWVWLVG